MTTISSLIQTLTTILANHGDLAITITNDATGELRYVDGIEVNEDLGEINLTHISFGEMLAKDNDIEFFADGAWGEMFEDGFIPSEELILILMKNPELLGFLFEMLGY